MKILHVAKREFVATALTKGFIIGALVVPAIMTVAIPLVITLLNQTEAPTVRGSVGVIDRSGQVTPALQEQLSEDAVKARQAEQAEQFHQEAAESMGPLAGNEESMRAKLEAAVPRPELTVEPLDPDADIEAERLQVRGSSTEDGGRLALLVIDEHAVVKGDDGYAGYELYHRPRMHDLTLSDLRSAIRTAIFETRARESGLDPDDVRALTRIESSSQEITETGEVRGSSEVLNIMLPFGFLILIMMSVFVSGQYLLTTTVEEKSSRVIEILLSAVSPMQLMAGKIIGQMAVGFALMSIYGSLGIAALLYFAYADLITPLTIIWLLLFYVIAYFLIASFMAAIGSAVNDMREAQAMMTPVVMVVMIPYLLAMPISRDPNSTLATVMSLIPPVSPFVMIVRVTSTHPPPLWQILLSIALGFLCVWFFLWACAKIFRVGLLMFGKPPNFKTLIHWIRMA